MDRGGGELRAAAPGEAAEWAPARRGEAARGCTRASPFLFFSLDPETGIDLDEFATELAELT